MNEINEDNQIKVMNKVKEEAERYLNIYRPTHGHLVLDDQYMKQIKASLEYGLLTRILSDIESVDVDYLNQLIKRLGESITADTQFKLSELANAISSVNNHVSSLDIQAIRDSVVGEVLNRVNIDSASLGSRLKALEDNLGSITSYSDDNTKKLQLELVSIADGINSKVSALEQYKITRAADDILLASKVSQLESIYEGNNKKLLARVREESESRIDGYKALTQQLTSMVSQVNNSVSTIDEVKRTYADLERSYSERISTLESSYEGIDTSVQAKLTEHSKTLTEANKALAKKVTSLEANIDGKIGAKFNEAIETVSSEQEALARKVSELNTSFLGLDGKLEGTIREEIKSVSDANKVHLSKLEELEGKTDTTLGKIESLKESIVTPEQVTNIVSDEMVAKYSNAKDKILDTRDNNELPRYYYNKYPNALAKEIKLSAVMGIDGEGELGYLETQTIGTNYREGKVTQVFYSEDGDTYKRVSISEDIWNVWKLQETDESAKEKLRLALLEIQQKIIESEARIDNYNKTHSDATKALAESLKQLEADYKEGDRVVNSRIVTLEQVQSTVDTARASTLQELNSVLDGVKGSIKKLQDTVTNPDGTVAVSEDMIRNLILDETKIKETKDANSTPEWYVSNHLGKTVKELKTSNVIDLTQSGDAYLETTVLSASVSNGSVKQEVVTEDAKVYTRQSTGLRAWSDWIESETNLTATARLAKAKEDLEIEIARVYSEFTDYKRIKTESDRTEALRVQGLSTKLESDYGTLQGLIRSEEKSRLEQDKSINERIDTISSNLGDNYATIRSVNETKSTLEENIARKGDEITSSFDNKLIEEREVTDTAIRTSADGVTQALTTKINEYKEIATNAKSTIDDYKRVNDSAVRALGERNTQLKGEFTKDIVNAKVAMQGVIDTTKNGLLGSIDEAKQGLETTIGEVRIVANKAKSDIAKFEKTLNDATQSVAEAKDNMKSRFEATELLITDAKDSAIRKAKEDAGELIEGATDTLKKYTDAGIDAYKKTQATENAAFARQYNELKASIRTLPTTTQVEAKIQVEKDARVDDIQALAKQITKGSVRFPNGTGNTNEVSSVLNDIIKATADSTFVDKSATFKATLHREVDEKMFRDAGNLLTDTINYTSWEYQKHSGESSLPSVNDGIWDLNGTTTNWKEIRLFSQEGTRSEDSNSSESLVQVTEGSEYILEFEAKGNIELNVFIRTYYTVGSSSRNKQITSTVSLQGTWTKHRVQIKCPELEANEIRNYIGIYFQSVSVGNAQIRKPRLYLDPSVLTAAIKEYKQMNLNMQGNLDAKIGLTVDSRNRVIGWTATERNNSSEFNIMADKFKISNSSNTRVPFSIDNTGNIVFNGKVQFSNVTNAPVIPDVPLTITAIGVSDRLPTNKRKIKLIVSGQTLNKHETTSGRGIWLSMVNPNTGAIISNNRYDTYTTAGCTAFKNAVNSLNKGTNIIIVRSLDASMKDNADLISGLNSLSNGFGNSVNEGLKEAVHTSFSLICQTIGNDSSSTCFIDSRAAGSQLQALSSGTILKGVFTATTVEADNNDYNIKDIAKAEADKKIDNLSVGGRNYIKDSAKDIAVKNPTSYIRYNTELDTITQPFVFSAYVKDVVGNNGNKLSVILSNPNHTNNLEQLTEAEIINNRIVVKFDTPKTPTNTSILVYANSGTWNGSATGSVTYYKAKMEFGNTATDWTPAPEDVDARVNSINPNLLAEHSPVNTSNYKLIEVDLLNAPKQGEPVTITLWGQLGGGRNLRVFNTGGNAVIGNLEEVGSGMYQLTAPWNLVASNGSNVANTQLTIYQMPSTASTTSRVDKVVMQYSTSSHEVNKAKAEAIIEAKSAIVLTSTQDLNTLVKSGTYLIRESNNTNAPIPNWLYVSVEGNGTDRVLQTVTQDNDDSIRYTRRKNGSTWFNWIKVVNEADVNRIVSNLKIPHILTAQGAHNNNNAWMKINSHTGSRTLAYTASEGIVVQILNPATLVVESATVYPKTSAGYLNMKNAISRVATHRVVMIASRTNVPIVNDNNLRDALRRAGSTDLIYETLYRRTNTTFALIGRVGIAGSAYESIVDTGSDMYGNYASVSAIWDAGELLPSNQTMVDGGRIVTNSITATQIAANAITANEINTDAIQTRHIQAGAVKTEQIYAKAINTQHINTNAINATHINTNSIKTEHIEAKSITVDKIADANITNAKIANGAINNAKIGNAAIKNANIENGAISNAKIENGAITTAKIGTAQVDTLQIKGEAVVIPRLQYSSNAFEFRSIDTEEEINRISIDPQGGAVSIQFTFESLTGRSGGGNDGSNGKVIIRIKRGTTTLRTINMNGEMISYSEQVGTRNGDPYYITRQYKNLNYSFVTLATLIDTPPAGNQVYTVTLESRGLNAGKSSRDTATYPIVITSRSFHILGVKR